MIPFKAGRAFSRMTRLKLERDAMITISLCMIVKNEERVLARCLDTVADLVDEIVIVDTGSDDRTKEIAARYTDRIYDFEWIDDFSAVRNYAFSLARMEYIYSADADEVLGEEARRQFRLLKENLLPEIEIVQMKYGNQLQYGTVYNYDEEYRPKLFKRLRNFVWEEPIHERVRTQPVVFDSDVVITHLPECSHAGRDLENFRRQTARGVRLSAHLHDMYARELYLNGNREDLLAAEEFFTASMRDEGRGADEWMQAACVAARAARLRGDMAAFYKVTMQAVARGGCSEICCELGDYYREAGDLSEAVSWYTTARDGTAAILSLACQNEIPNKRIAETAIGEGSTLS